MLTSIVLGVSCSGLLVAATGSAQCTAAGSDAEVRAIAVAPGVELEVVDWGGRGPPLVFLPGFGNTAHVYATFAPRFTDAFHVLAITRLGFGDSSRPESGYGVPSLAAMTLAVLDSMSLDTVTLVAHSFGATSSHTSPRGTPIGFTRRSISMPPSTFNRCTPRRAGSPTCRTLRR